MMEVVTGSFFMLCLCYGVGGGDASLWIAEVPGSVSGLLGSCVVIPCSFDYPEPEKETSQLTGIWADGTKHLIYHPDGSKVMQDYRHRTQLLGDLRQKNCSLKIDPLRASDGGPFHFRIEIEDHDKYSYTRNDVSITVTSSPEPLSFSLPEVTKAGETVSASCSATHSCPADPPRFTWSRLGTPSSQSKRLTDGQWEATSTLTFHPAPSDHEQALECTATYRGGQRTWSSKTLQVKYAPVIVDVGYSPTVKEGEPVELSCNSDGYPAAHSHRWHSASGALLSTGHIYRLPNVSRNTEALYCTAINTEGQRSSPLVKLNVLYPPEIKVGSSCSSHNTSAVTCVCIVESRPGSMVQWVLPNKILPSTKVERHGSITIGTLQGELGFSDLVHCRANNTQGNATFIMSLPSNNKEIANVNGKMLILSIAIGAAAVTVMIFLAALGLIKKCRGSHDDHPVFGGQDVDTKSAKLPNYSSVSRKGQDSGMHFTNLYTNEHVYGNMETVGDGDLYECVADDHAVYANV